MKYLHDTHDNTHVPNTIADLRAAFGPGYQFGGPSDAALRTITRTRR